MNKIYKSSKFGILLLTVILFSCTYFISISEIIILSLSFLILIEIVRTIYDYVVQPTHRIKVRYVIDSAILFGIRELFVGWVMLKTELSIALIIMFVSLFAIMVLIMLRTSVIKNSPDVLE